MFDVISANPSDLPVIEAAYAEACRAMRGTPEDIDWEMGSHPSHEGLLASAEAGDLVWAREKDASHGCLGAFVLNGKMGPGYDEPEWVVPCPPSEVAVLHLLMVAPAARGRGIACALLRTAAGLARSRGCRSLRLDVFSNNAPGIALYRGFGFVDHGHFAPTYEGLGPVDVHLMEYPL